MRKIAFTTLLSHIEITYCDLEEQRYYFGEAAKKAAAATSAFGVELTRLAMEAGVDEEGYFLPELLAAKSETDAALVELNLIASNQG